MARLSSAPNPPPTTSTRSSSLDKFPQLVGQLNADGIASLKADTVNNGSSSSPPRSLRAALEAVAGPRQGISDTSSETASEEDYDALKHDPMAVTRGGKGGGFTAEDAVSTPGLITDGKSYEGLKTKPSKARPVSTRLRSMYVFMK